MPTPISEMERPDLPRDTKEVSGAAELHLGELMIGFVREVRRRRGDVKRKASWSS